MPFEAAFGKKPDLKGVREWGEKTYVRVEGGTKLGGPVKEGRWLGVNDESKGVRIYWPDTKLVTVERNIYYNNLSARHLEEEMEIGLVKTTADSPEKAPIEVQNPDTTPITKSKDDNPEIEPENKRIQEPSQKVADLLAGKGSWSANNSQTALTPGMQQPTDWTAGAVECEDKYALLAEIGLAEALEPRNLGEAKKKLDWPLWEVAIDEELKTLKETETWEVVEVPAGVNVVRSKWVFQAKKDAAGNVVRYRARLVAQGFTQVPGVNYFDMFTPVARLASIRTVLTFAAAEDYDTGQIDIKAAYLNGELTEDERIYMKQAPGYKEPGEQEKVVLLRL